MLARSRGRYGSGGGGGIVVNRQKIEKLLVVEVNVCWCRCCCMHRRGPADAKNLIYILLNFHPSALSSLAAITTPETAFILCTYAVLCVGLQRL